MSRIGNRILTIPAGVEVNVDGNNITVKGPKGTLNYTFRNNVEVKVEDGKIVVTRKDDSKDQNSHAKGSQRFGLFGSSPSTG